MESPYSHRTHAGAAVYTTLVLKCYDAWVLGLSNRWVWRCPTRQVLLPFYRKHASARHLEVGAGSGYYLARAGFATGDRLTLLDLNPHSLHAAGARAPAGVDVELVLGDVLAAGAALPGRRYDSIALFYLLHCLPGDMRYKALALSELRRCLSADGVLYGATILGDGADHNIIGRWLMRVYNRKGIFGNRHDTIAGLQAALAPHFQEVEITRRGKVALFTARKPMPETASMFA